MYPLPVNIMHTIPVTTTPTVNKIIVLHTELTPLAFCEQWLGLEKMSEIKRLEVKESLGFRSRCNKALAKALNISEGTVKNWGSIQFERIPSSMRKRLPEILLYQQLRETLLFEDGQNIVIKVVLGKGA